MAYAVRAGTLIDGTGRDPVTDVAVTVDGERIARVGPGGDAPSGPDDLTARASRSCRA